MDERTRRRRVIEWGKDVLILLLTCSALWMATRSGMLEPLGGLLGEKAPQPEPGKTQTEGRIEAARPLRMTAVLAEENETVRCGILYDGEACEALFQQVAGLLVEALSSAEEPERVSREQWEAALTDSTGVCFDFQGEIPLPVLAGWLSKEDCRLSACVRRLSMSVWEDSVALYYRDEGDGNYYRCRSEVANPLHLKEALAGLADNGAFYAFESDEYDSLDPDTLLETEIPSQPVYASVNPAAGGQTVLEELARDLEFAINTNGVYYAGEWVARSGNDTLRLSNRGTAVYLAGEGGGDHFRVSDQGMSGELFDAVETCRQLAISTLGKRCGEARIYLISAEASEEGWEIKFGYCLNGIPVQLEEGYAARFLVRNRQVTQFTLCFRSYTSGEGTGVVLPVRQAAAALEAMGLEGEELMLAYTDGGGESVAAGWIAAGRGLGKE